MNSPQTPIVIIAGPTGAGKTGLALELAARFGAQIISADAVAVYRGMDIGSAKPTMAERSQVTHHLIDILNPDEPYDAARFAEDASTIIENLAKEGKNAFVVGGTGLYIKALLYGLIKKGRSDNTLRDCLRRELAQKGAKAMHERLEALDPVAAKRIHANDSFRVLRAIEICELTGRPVADLRDEHGFAHPRYKALFFCLKLERQVLYERINRRVEAMVEQGLADEVSALIEKGYGPQLKPMQAIGYCQMARHLAGEISLDETISLIQRDTRRFAKRQLTWFSAMPGITWVEPHKAQSMADLISTHLNKP
ncbi:MAG: tRNA (adenosine(37)-N6)-dimethylallyltransferase MiaA [Desulfatibacillaceae bacterium]|nr:tRNA (adenosine(37)-N6)-dimethylallyltransferase MiaA [Desulfatibacillaceae bacterium]